MCGETAWNPSRSQLSFKTRPRPNSCSLAEMLTQFLWIPHSPSFVFGTHHTEVDQLSS